jgi:hypothetical protein
MLMDATGFIRVYWASMAGGRMSPLEKEDCRPEGPVFARPSKIPIDANAAIAHRMT